MKTYCPPTRSVGQIHVVSSDATSSVVELQIGDLLHVEFAYGVYPGGMISSLRSTIDDDCIAEVGSFSSLPRAAGGEVIVGSGLMVAAFRAAGLGTATISVYATGDDGSERIPVNIAVRVTS